MLWFACLINHRDFIINLQIPIASDKVAVACFDRMSYMCEHTLKQPILGGEKFVCMPDATHKEKTVCFNI